MLWCRAQHELKNMRRGAGCELRIEARTERCGEKADLCAAQDYVQPEARGDVRDDCETRWKMGSSGLPCHPVVTLLMPLALHGSRGLRQHQRCVGNVRRMRRSSSLWSSKQAHGGYPARSSTRSACLRCSRPFCAATSFLSRSVEYGACVGIGKSVAVFVVA